MYGIIKLNWNQWLPLLVLMWLLVAASRFNWGHDLRTKEGHHWTSILKKKVNPVPKRTQRSESVVHYTWSWTCFPTSHSAHCLCFTLCRVFPRAGYPKVGEEGFEAVASLTWAGEEQCPTTQQLHWVRSVRRCGHRGLYSMAHYRQPGFSTTDSRLQQPPGGGRWKGGNSVPCLCQSQQNQSLLELIKTFTTVCQSEQD